MKIALSGHTSGLGKSIQKIFPDAMGFSRSNGFDLTLLENRRKMYDSIIEYDIFINNAYLRFQQVNLLYELWEKWKNQDKLIINIGSDAGDYNQDYARPYTVHKRALEDACIQLQHSSSPCRVILLKPGYIDTPRVEEIALPKINPDELSLYIKELIEQRHKTFWISTVTVYPK